MEGSSYTIFGIAYVCLTKERQITQFKGGKKDPGQ